MWRKLVGLLAWLPIAALADVHVYWTPSVSDTDGNAIEAEHVVYHIWVYLDVERGFVDYGQTPDTEFTIYWADSEFVFGKCYPIYVTARRTDTDNPNLQSEPSGTVTLCYTDAGMPYDGDNPPTEDEIHDFGEGQPKAPVISIEVVNEVATEE